MMMIEKPCDACLKRFTTALDDGAILNNENAMLYLHCSHHSVGINAQASRGVVVDWGLVYAPTIEHFRLRVGQGTVAHVLYDMTEAQFIAEAAVKY